MTRQISRGHGFLEAPKAHLASHEIISHLRDRLGSTGQAAQVWTKPTKTHNILFMLNQYAFGIPLVPARNNYSLFPLINY